MATRVVYVTLVYAIIDYFDLSHAVNRIWSTSSTFQKGCIDYLKKEDADVYGLQEVKCSTEDFPKV